MRKNIGIDTNKHNTSTKKLNKNGTKKTLKWYTFKYKDVV